MLLTQKLRLAADFINNHLAQSQMERVAETGLYDATDTDNNRVHGLFVCIYVCARAEAGKGRPEDVKHVTTHMDMDDEKSTVSIRYFEQKHRKAC